jgi:protein LTV1
MEGAIDPAAAAAAEEEEEGEDEEEQYGEYEEYYEDGEEYEEGEEYEDGEEEKDGGARPAKSAAARRRAAAEEDEDEEDEEEEEEEEEDDGRPKRPLDAAFDKLLEDEYSDGEIGELDQLAEEDPAALEGHLDLDDLADEIGVDDFVASSSKFKSEGGSLIDKVDPQLQGLTLAKLALVTAGEKSLREIETDISAMLDPPVRDTWDAESILSTYSNLENHPRVLREPRRNKAKQIQPDLNASSGSGSGGARSHAARQHLAAFQAPLPIPERALRQGDADGSQDEEEDEEGEDAEEEGGHAGGENKGKARAADETPEEKKARKQAVKLAKREAKG